MTAKPACSADNTRHPVIGQILGYGAQLDAMADFFHAVKMPDIEKHLRAAMREIEKTWEAW